jgi:2-oxoisovalerate ferredoxin oxidoreductase alpha subunit
MVEPLNFPQTAVEPVIDPTWAVCGNRETRGNLVTSIDLDFKELEAHNLNLQAKYDRIRENEVDYEEYRIDDAEIVLVSYGISSRIAKSAVDAARREGIRAGLFRPVTLFPFPAEELKALAERGSGFISVEMSDGQMREDIRLATGCRDVGLVSRYGGNLIGRDEIMEKMREVA